MLIINGQRVRQDRTTGIGTTKISDDGKTFDPGLIFDEGFAFGRGAFETLPVLARPVWLEHHLERLNRTLGQLGINRQLEAQAIYSLIDREHIHDEALKIIVTAENLVLSTRPLPVPAPDGMALMVSPHGHPATSPLAGMKTLNYLGYLLAREQAVHAGFSDALLLSSSGRILETAAANIFTIDHGRIRTPRADGSILPGIVRQHILARFDVDESDLTMEDLTAADEVFVTNSLIGVQRVLRIGDHQLQEVTGSPILTAIKAEYDQAMQTESI